MTRAIGLSAFVLALLSPFVGVLYVGALGIAAFAALIIWVWLRHREPEIDIVQLQIELEGHVRKFNAEDGK
jgi:hypothetical protein